MGEVVVVGAGGTLGARLVEHLGVRGLEVRAADVAGEHAVRAVASADAVVNVGGPRVRPGLGWGDYFREHVALTSALVRSMRAGARFVHVSSTAVFGARGAKLTADSPEMPTSFPSPAYACAKLAAEMAARAVGTARGVEVMVLRPSMVYGRGLDSALSTLRRLHRRGVHLKLVPRPVRQHLLHLDLFVRAVRQAIVAPVAQFPLVVADPFVLTNDDLAPPGGWRVPVPVDVRWAARAHGVLARSVGVSGPALEALAVLGIDNEFDVASTWSVLGIDPREHRREQTFDAYWSAQ